MTFRGMILNKLKFICAVYTPINNHLFYNLYKYDTIDTLRREIMKKILFCTLLLTIYSSAGTIEETKRSCEAGDAKSCKIMGDLTRAGLGVEQDETKALNYYDIACFYGNKDACKELEVMKND